MLTGEIMCKRDSRYMPMTNQKGMPHVHFDSFRSVKESWGIAGIAF